MSIVEPASQGSKAISLSSLNCALEIEKRLVQLLVQLKKKPRAMQ